MNISSTLASSLLVLSSLTNANIQTTVNSFNDSSVLYDLKSDENFNIDDFSLNSSVSDDKAIKAITLTRENNDLFFYIFNENGKSLDLNLKETQISISCSNDFNDIKYYDATIIDKTEDNLFYKFKITDISSSTQYHLGDIEFDYGEGYASGRHNTIAASYFFQSNENNPYEVKELDVINLTINPGNYRFSTINGNGNYTDLFYITFQLNSSYGDLVAINLNWKEDVTDYYSKIDFGNPSQSYDRDNSYTSDLITMNYTSSDLLNIESINSIGTNFEKFILNINPYYWFTDQDKDYSNIPVIEKINYDNKNQSTFENYYFNADTINSLNNQYYDVIGGQKNNYVIRFSIKDYFWDTYMTAGYQVTKNIKTEIKDCDVLSLTFAKDGTTYTLIASSEPVDYDPGINNPDNFLQKLLELLEQVFGNYAEVALIIGSIIVLFVVMKTFEFLFVPKKWR